MGLDALHRESRAADRAIARERARLINAARAASRSGYSQRQIAEAMGRSQPEVNRLLRFHGTSPGGVVLRKQRQPVVSTLSMHGLTSPRVFGSTARGEDTPTSDIDLLVRAERPIGLLTLAAVEEELSKVLDRKVDLVLDHAIREDLAESIRASAVPL